MLLVAVVITFKIVYGLWQTRQDNDKRIQLLLVHMTDMMDALRGYVSWTEVYAIL